MFDQFRARVLNILILLDLNDMTLEKQRYSSYLEMSVSISTVGMPTISRAPSRTALGS